MSNEHDRDRDPADEAGELADPTATPDDAADRAREVGDEPTSGAPLTADERDDLDEVARDEDDETSVDDEDDDDGERSESELVGAGVGGAAAGSARAAARRSSVRAGVTEKKGRATAARDDDRDDRPNVFARILRFLREVVAELRKVIWPHRSQLITYTTVVLVFVVFMTALVFGLDWLFARGVLAVFGGGS